MRVALAFHVHRIERVRSTGDAILLLPVATPRCLACVDTCARRVAQAIPSCPSSASVITTNQGFVRPNTGVQPGVRVTVDIQAYGDATLYTAADVPLDVESYATSTILLIGGSGRVDIDAYTNSRIHLHAGTVVADASAYGSSTIRIHGG
jgi:hypothetical protein